MLVSIFKISIILSVTASALPESRFQSIINFLSARMKANTATDLDSTIWATFHDVTHRHGHSKTTPDLEKLVLQAISDVLIAHMDTPLGPFVMIDGKLCYFSDKEETVYEATERCNSVGASLVTINNKKEMAALSKFLMRYPLDRYWWIKNNKLSVFHDWSTGQPDNARFEHFIHLWYQNATSRFQMNDVQSYWRNFYICEK